MTNEKSLGNDIADRSVALLGWNTLELLQDIYVRRTQGSDDDDVGDGDGG